MNTAEYVACEIRVDLQTPGSYRTLSTILKNIKGLALSIDAHRELVYIAGQADPNKILKLLAKAGEHADLLWVDSGSHLNPNRTNDNQTTLSGSNNNIQDHYNHNYPPTPFSRNPTSFYGNNHRYDNFYGCNNYYNDYSHPRTSYLGRTLMDRFDRPNWYSPYSHYSDRYQNYDNYPYDRYGPRNNYFRDLYGPYYDSPAGYFPQAPPPVKNPRLETLFSLI